MRLTLLLVTMTAFLSCRYAKKSELQFYPVCIDTSEIPINNFAIIIKTVPAIVSKLGLDDMTKGTENFSVRFWLPDTVGKERIQTLSISYINGRWVSGLVSFNIKYPQQYDNSLDKFSKIEPENITTTKLTPRINITELLVSINSLNLQNAPPNSIINKDQELSTQNIRYIVEFADQGGYRVIHYFKTCKKADKTEFEKKFSTLLELIRKYYQIEFS